MPEDITTEPEPNEVSPEKGEPVQEMTDAPTEEAAPDTEAVETPSEPEEEEEHAEVEEPGEEPPPPETWAEEDKDYKPLPYSEEENLAFWREEAEPLTPLEIETSIADRYTVIEVLDVQEDEILYLAHDLRRCWQCGFEDNAPDDAFCAQCGASLDHKPEVRLLEVQDTETDPSNSGKVAAQITHHDRTFLLLTDSEPKPETKPEALPAPPNPRLLVGHCSHAGQVRRSNQDSLLVLTLSPTYGSRTGPVQGLFAVADGMGGHEGGEVASKLALQVLADHVLRTIILPEMNSALALDEDIIAYLHQAVTAANDAVYLARKKRENDMGTTLTATFVRDDRLFLAHVGDCRTYRWNANGLEQLTADHSVVASMVASGEAAPEDVYTHPHRSVIYRCIGDKPLVEVDTDMLPLSNGDRLVLCSDGLWEMIRSKGIGDVLMQEADPKMACETMVRRANAAGGDDNISVIVVQIE
jgi:serine/threonine protein phosphatase PrpC